MKVIAKTPEFFSVRKKISTVFSPSWLFLKSTVALEYLFVVDIYRHPVVGCERRVVAIYIRW